MPRIRSTHPGQWTDENFTECSMAARLLCLALRNMADDRGVFRWKPKTIKMICLPADNCDIDDLLDELIDNNQVDRYEFEGKQYGIINDFTQWQRPKKPTAIHPIPECVRNKHGLSKQDVDSSSPPVPHQSPNGTEIAPQREEVRCRRKDDIKDTNVSFIANKKIQGAGVCHETIPDKPKPRNRKITIPDDWDPPPESLEYALSKGLTAREFANETDRFKTSASANGRKYINWNSAWRQWLDHPEFGPIARASNAKRGAFGSSGGPPSATAIANRRIMEHG